MTRARLSALAPTFLLCLALSGPALADGGMFWREAADLAETRQTALLLVQPDHVTYVVQMVYTGQAQELAWILPVAATPTNVVAHQDDNLFAALDSLTRPTISGYAPVGGCACGVGAGPGGGSVVQVEAQGQAGIYDWVALTSTGSGALLQWLTGNGFNVPAEASPVLDGYIQQNMHFLAIRVHDASSLTADASRGVPPIQFDVATTDWYYPMTISRISAAPATEVTLYFLAPKRVQASNVPNGQIDPGALRMDPDSPSGTNYETLFTQQVASLGDMAMITESAGLTDFGSYLQDVWPLKPAAVSLADLTLTRMRTIASPAAMTKDLRFEPGPDEAVESHFSISYGSSSAANVVGQTAAAVLACGLFVMLCKRNPRFAARP